MAKLTNSELLAILEDAIQGALINQSDFAARNEKLVKAYFQEPYGNEVPGRSQVVASDVAEVVESDMPSLARIFLSGLPPVQFVPRGISEQEEKEAEEKTQYIHWLVSGRPWSYREISAWMKDAEINKFGAVKYFVEDTIETEEVEYSGVSEIELAEIVDSLNGNDVEKLEIIEQEESLVTNESGEPETVFDVRFRVKRKCREFKFQAIPTESFLISAGARDKWDAQLVGDITRKTRSQLKAEGFPADLVDSLPAIKTGNESQRGGLIKFARNKDVGSINDDVINARANEEIEIKDLYVRVDYDGDGIAERRHIIIAGGRIIENEPFDHVPYALLSCILMPHRAIGRSRAEMVEQDQKIKTAILRQTLDNMYLVNSPRNVVHPDVVLDDLLTVRPGGIIRLDAKTSILPAQAVQPQVTPYVGDKALQVIQYLDMVRAAKTGATATSQGLHADALNKETAARFKGIRDDSKAKIELVARNFAETGFRELYEGMCWLVSHYQDSATEIRVLGKTLKIDPTAWKYRHETMAKVGLGAGDAERMLASMQGLLDIQLQLAEKGLPLVDIKKIYNTLEEVVKTLGFKRADKFFNDPERPEQLVLAENQQLQAALVQAQQIIQQLQQQISENPLAEAEQIKAQAKLIEAKSRQDIEAAKLAEKSRIEQEKLQLDLKKHLDNLAARLTELEVKSGKNIPGSSV